MIGALILSIVGISVLGDLSGVEIPNNRTRVNFHGFNYARLHVDSSLTTATIRVEYSLNDGGSWATLASFAPLAATAPSESSWVSIPQEAKVDVLLRALVVGVFTPSVRYVAVQAHG